MALTEARKKANAKYEAKAYDKTLIRLPKGRLDEIRAHIEPNGESLNGFIGRAISEAMERGTSREIAGHPISHFEGAGVSLPPETLKAVQEASEATGETQTEFVSRAVGIQIQRDKATLKLGINPATGDKLEPDRKGGEQNE